MSWHAAVSSFAQPGANAEPEFHGRKHLSAKLVPFERESHCDSKGSGTVAASDGELLGTVTEVGGTYVKLSAPMSVDYWLPVESIRETETDLLRTTFASGELSRYRREPEPLAHHSGRASFSGSNQSSIAYPSGSRAKT